jgi:NAD(P)-dependent dehydrogenase (short-subunit alcohol dehydrogenase family)
MITTEEIRGVGMNIENIKENLNGRNIILTGGTKGFGFSLAQELVKRQANLLICARSKVSIDSALAKLDLIKRGDQKIFGCATDISNSREVNDLYTKTKKIFGKIDILINNAGIIGSIDKFLDIDLDKWQEVISVNFIGSALMIKRFLPDMLEQKFGRIIQLSGGGATTPLQGMSAYASSKVAIVRLIETLSNEYVDSGVEFNSVAPGMLKTRLLDEMLAAGPEKIGKGLFKKTKDRSLELKDSTEMACKLVLFLCSDDSRGISGKLISAEWDNWQIWPEHLSVLANSDLFTLRRITGKDRNFILGDN